MSEIITIRQRIRDQIILELNTNRPEDLPIADKRRWYPVQSDDALSMSVVFVREDSKPVGGRSGSLQDRELQIAVQCVAGSAYRDQVDDIIEPALAWATEVLGNTNLNGMATEIVELGIVWEQAKMDKFYLAAQLNYHIRFQTPRNDVSKVQ